MKRKMTPEQRQRLHSQLVALQKKLENDEIQQDLACTEKQLADLGFDHELIANDFEWVRWIVGRFPGGGKRIDWSEIPNAEREIGGIDHLSAFVEAHMPPALIEANPSVIVLSAARRTAVRSSLTDALGHLFHIAAASHDVWVFDPSDTWLLEWWHEGEWAFGLGSDREATPH